LSKEETEKVDKQPGASLPRQYIVLKNNVIGAKRRRGREARRLERTGTPQK